MDHIIEDNFIELQKKTTHVLVEQKVIISDQEQIDDLLDRINETKILHKSLIPEYQETIEMVAKHLCSSMTKEDLICISEMLHNLVGLTERLIKSFDQGRLRDCYTNELTQYNVLLNDLKEILYDINYRVDGDSEMIDLLRSL